MRIAHLITRLILGGAQENTLLNCIDLQQRYGDEVLLVTGPGLGPEGSLESQARTEGVPLRIIPSLRRNIHPLRDGESYFALRRALREFRPEVVHTHSGKAGLLGRQAAWSLRVPAIVHTVHGAPFHEYQGRGARRLFQACERYAARRCDRLISVADAMTERMVAAQVAPREKFTTIYSGMPIAPLLEAEALRTATRHELGLKPGAIVVGKIARFFHLKGHDDFLAAAALVLREHPQTKFLLVGDGLLRDDIQRRINEQGMGDAFRLTGLVTPEQIPSLLAAMDIAVHTSLREGLARVLPQALLAARPVVSFDIDGAREAVVDGETGFLIPPRDIKMLAGAISRLIADPQLRERLAGEGRRRCREMFPIERMTDQIRALYESILEVSVRRPAE